MMIGSRMLLMAGGGGGGGGPTDPYWSNVKLLYQPPYGTTGYVTEATGLAVTYNGVRGVNWDYGADIGNPYYGAISGGSCVALDGAAGYISLSGTGIGLSNTAFTVEVLVNRGASGTSDCIVSHGSGGLPGTEFDLGFNSSNQLVFNGYSSSSSYVQLTKSSMGTGDMHIAVTHDGSGNYTLYHDAVSAATASGKTASLDGGGATLQLGAFTGGGGQYLQGRVYAIRVTVGVARAIAIPTALWPTS